MTDRRKRSIEARRPVDGADGVGLERAAGQEVEDEIAFHLASRTDQLIAQGVEPEVARQQAEAEFGGVAEARTDLEHRTRVRRVRRRRARAFRDLIQDIRFGLRGIRSAPVLFAVAAISLAMGMGAVNTMWTAVDRTLLRPLPYDADGTLVFVGPAQGGAGRASNPMASADFLDLDDRARSLRLAAYRDGGVNLEGEPPEWVITRWVTESFLEVVELPLALGRGFDGREASAGAGAAVLSHGLWARRFGSDPGVIGRSVRVDGSPVTIVGVLEGDLHFGFNRRSPDLLLPLQVRDDEDRGNWNLNVVGRLSTPDGLQTARAELASLGQALAGRHPETNGERTFLAERAIRELFSGPVVAQGLGGSLVAAFLVLLIACANVANLLLARGATRAPDIALRRALGAGRGRIVRQLLAEAALLAVVGGLLGVVISRLGVTGLASLMPPDMPRSNEVALDLRGAGAGMVIALGSVLFFGMVPALRTLRQAERQRLLTQSGRSSAGRDGRLRSGLVAAELGLTLILVTTTAIVVSSVRAVQAIDSGFVEENVWTFRVTLPSTAYPDEAATLRAGEELVERVRALPGVSAAGLGVGVPGGGWISRSYSVPDNGDGQAGRVLTRTTDGAYLDVLGLQPIRGRAPGAADQPGSPIIGAVNETFARQVWGDRDPIGRTIRIADRMVQVVGVLPDVREVGAQFSPWGAIYLPLAQWPNRSLSVVLQAMTEDAPLGAIRRVVGDMEGDVAIRSLQPLTAQLEQSAGGMVALSRLIGTMAIGALMLALIGVYAATSYGVVRRVPEIGVRMALGADRKAVRRMVLGSTARTNLLGLGVGLPLAWGAAHGMSRFMFGDTASNGLIYLGTAAALLAVSVLAAWKPARQASAVDPMRALRAD